jgi:hypothetical protein
MAPGIQHQSIEALLEDAEDDSSRGAARVGNGMNIHNNPRNHDPFHDTTMSSRNPPERSRDKAKRSHKSSAISLSRHSKSKSKSSSKHQSSSASREDNSLVRHRRHRTNREDDLSSTDEEIQDYTEVLRQDARKRLTSPSLISNLTSMTALTTATNNSGGSSGSNSTITQASMSRHIQAKDTMKDGMDGPISPGIFEYFRNMFHSTDHVVAVPDPPDVFSYLDPEDDEEYESEHHEEGKHEEQKEDIEVALEDDDDEDSEEHEGEEEGEEEEEDDHESNHEEDDTEPKILSHGWFGQHSSSPSPPSPTSDTSDGSDLKTPVPPEILAAIASSSTHSLSSSASSFRSSSGSEPLHDDTDRSTSPERSVKGAPSPRSLNRNPPSPISIGSSPIGAFPKDDTVSDSSAAKVAAQMLAAQHRQNLHTTHSQKHGTHHVRFANTPAQRPRNQDHDAAQEQALSPRNPTHLAPPPAPQGPPLSGYEALASALAALPSQQSHDDGNQHEGQIQPMYRKFTALNHRVLLYLQDELSELEDQLRNLDAMDTQYRTTEHSKFVVPGSRRQPRSAQLEGARREVLGQVGWKLSQYNSVLKGFGEIEQGFEAPEEGERERYQEFIEEGRWVVDAEMGWVGREDLVVLGRGKERERDRERERERVGMAERRRRKEIVGQEMEYASEISSLYPSSVGSSQASSPTAILHKYRKEQPLSAGQQPVYAAAASASSSNSQITQLTAALIAAVLIPVLTFTVIPGFIGRMTVAGLVATAVTCICVQAGIEGVSGGVWGREGMVCAGGYLVAMVVLAGLVG